MPILDPSAYSFSVYAVPTLVTKRDDLLSPVGGYRAPGARHLLPPVLRHVVYLPPPLIVLALAMASLLAAGAAARRRVASAPLAVPIVGLLLTVPYAAIVWHGDAFEVGRHALVVQLLVRLCPLLIGLLVLDAVKGKSLTSSNKRPS